MRASIVEQTAVCVPLAQRKLKILFHIPTCQKKCTVPSSVAIRHRVMCACMSVLQVDSAMVRLITALGLGDHNVGSSPSVHPVILVSFLPPPL